MERKRQIGFLRPTARQSLAVKVASAISEELALLWQFRFAGVGEGFLTVGTSPGWRPCEEVEDGLPDGRHARLWWRSPDSFFSVPLLLGGGIGGRRRRSLSSKPVRVTPYQLYLP